jgi:hypothetical protein
MPDKHRDFSSTEKKLYFFLAKSTNIPQIAFVADSNQPEQKKQ